MELPDRTLDAAAHEVAAEASDVWVCREGHDVDVGDVKLRQGLCRFGGLTEGDLAGQHGAEQDCEDEQGRPHYYGESFEA